MTDRGVSEALGFVFVFAIVISTVGVVYTAGFGGLQDARDFERVNNAQRAFDVLSTNVDDVTHRNAPSRSTEIKLADASLGFADPVTVTVRGDHATDDTRNFSRSVAVHPIVFTADTGTRLLYSAGSVLRARQDVATTVTQPEFVLDSDRVLIPVVATRPAAGTDPVNGSKTVLVRAERSTTAYVATETTGSYETVWLNVTSPRAELWKETLTARGMTCSLGTTDAGEERVICTLSDVDRVYVTVSRIDVAFR